MDRRSGVTLGGSDVAGLASSAGVEAVVGWDEPDTTDFGPPAKYKATMPAMTISGTIAAMIGMSKLRWLGLTGFTKAGLTGCAWAGLPTSTEYTRTGSAMFLSWVAPRLRLPVGILRETDGTGLGDPFQPRGDVDAVTHQVAVALLNHIAEMDADAKLDAALGRQASIALDHPVLHFNCAAHGVDHTSELDEDAIARPLNYAAMMQSDGGVEQIAAQRTQPRQRPLLVGRGKPAVSGDIGRQNRREFPGLGHWPRPVRKPV